MNPVDPGRSEFLDINGLRHHLRRWGQRGGVPLVILHGWMDNSASFALFANRLDQEWDIVAPDLRGFGLTEYSSTGYWFPDYLRDLDLILEHYWPDSPVNLLGHSMGGNIAGLYAGVRPARIRRLISVEGFGLPDSEGSDAPDRYAEWLDFRANPPKFRGYKDLATFAKRLQRLHPRMDADQALWLAGCWSLPSEDGGLSVNTDPLHKIKNPVLYRLEETMACWRQITAPVLWIQGDDSDYLEHLRKAENDDELGQRRACFKNLKSATIRGAGHMIHHDQPDHLARVVTDFISRSR